jgi:hypothetical protein
LQQQAIERIQNIELDLRTSDIYKPVQVEINNSNKRDFKKNKSRSIWTLFKILKIKNIDFKNKKKPLLIVNI